MDYQVGINPEAMFSVFYEDRKGRLIFVIEVDDEPRKIYLNPRPSQNGQMVDLQDNAESARVNLAVQRLKTYFEGQGLSVELD